MSGRDCCQVGVKAARTLAPSDLVSQPAKLTAYYDRVLSAFRPLKVMADGEVVATYAAPNRPDVIQRNAAGDAAFFGGAPWCVLSEVRIDGRAVPPYPEGSLGGGIALPVIQRTIEVSWLVGIGVLEFLAEKSGALPEGYDTTPKAIEIAIVTNFFGPKDHP